MRRLILLSIFGCLAACGEVYRDTGTPMVAMGTFDPERYLGLWYEIARYPVPFQQGCTATTAEYGAIDDDTISVLNTCRTGSPDGPIERIAGQADIVGPGQLKVSFDNVPFVRGDYVVLWVDDDYSAAVVGVPSGKAGWILSRTPELTEAARREAEAVFEANGYDLTKLLDVPQR